MSTQRAVSLGRCCATVAIFATVAAIALTVLLAQPQRTPLVVAIVGALAWGLGGSFSVALMPTGLTVHSDAPGCEIEAEAIEGASREGFGVWDQSDGPTIGTLMNLGRVPDQVARMTSAIAASSGPVVLVVPAGRAVPVGLDPAVLIVESDRPEAADTMAAFYRLCDAVLIVSSRALPTTDCRNAARLLTDGASWVQGRAEPLNHDRFGPVGRESLDARLRKRAADAGLWNWEPDATIVSTSLLESHPITAGRPMGAWLRERSAEGSFGSTVDTVLARRAAPVAAEGYWPDTTARQCAWAADLSDAARSGSGDLRARAIATGLLVRALSGWSVLCWLAVLVLLTDGSPVRHSGGGLAVMVLASVTLRWLAPRLVTQVRPSPFADVVAGLYGLPGSLAATVSAVTRRVRPPRRAVSTRPLVWLALIATGAAANVVLTAEPGVGAARLAAGVAVALLLLTWVFTVRSLIERSWRRIGFRIPLDLPAIVEGAIVEGVIVQGAIESPGWRLVDGGPGGCALVGPATGYAQGDEITIRMPRPDGESITLHGTVAATRGHDLADELMGVEIRTVEPGSAAWAEILAAAASHIPASIASAEGLEAAIADAPVDEHVDQNRWGHRLDRLAIGLVLVMSIAVALSLGLVMVGVRPLVIRSGSMEPTYGVGDVVLVSSEPAAEIRKGQVVTRFDAPEASDSLTHRVRQITRTGDEVEVETRGDANDRSEYWSVPAGGQVGVVVGSVPVVGLLFTTVRSSTSWAVIVGALVIGVIGMLFRPRRRRAEQAPVLGGSLKPADSVPTNSSMTSIGDPK